MKSSQQCRVQLPDEIVSISNAMGVYYIFHGIVLWLGAAFLAWQLWQLEAVPMAFRLLGMVALYFVSGLGVFFVGLMGHEGFHGTLNRNRRVSMVMGIIPSTLLPGFLSVGYNVMHWQHHQHTNTEKDPDYMMYRKNTSLLSRVIFGPNETMQTCTRNALRLAWGIGAGDRTYPFSPREAKFYAWLNILVGLAVVALYALLAFNQPLMALFMVGIPVAMGWVHWSLAPYIEHAETRVGPGVDTRSSTSWILNLLMVGYGYHLCHHLYPRVQLHKLPALDRFLRQEGVIGPDAPIEPNPFRALKVGAFGNLKFD